MRASALTFAVQAHEAPQLGTKENRSRGGGEQREAEGWGRELLDAANDFRVERGQVRHAAPRQQRPRGDGDARGGAT